MSGPAHIGDNIFIQLDVCYISPFTVDGITYQSVYQYLERNKYIDTDTSLVLKATIAKLEWDIDILNKLIESKKTRIEYPYNNTNINYALILRAIRAYFQGEEEEYYNILSELGC
jgi:hypothetical protein